MKNFEVIAYFDRSTPKDNITAVLDEQDVELVPAKNPFFVVPYSAANIEDAEKKVAAYLRTKGILVISTENRLLRIERMRNRLRKIRRFRASKKRFFSTIKGMLYLLYDALVMMTHFKYR